MRIAKGLLGLLLTLPMLAAAEEIGEVSTVSSGWGRMTRLSSRPSMIPRLRV